MIFDVRDYILVLDNIISFELCNEILNEYKNDRNWTNTTIASGLERNIRRCDAINMSNAFIIEQNQEKRQLIDNKIYKCAADAIKQYNEQFQKAKIQGDSGYTLLRYQEEEFYSEHTDHFLQQPRIVSCSFALNDDYEGGEFAFFNRKLKYKLSKGSAIMFPSNFLYPHEIMPVTQNVRYSVITWFI